MNAVHYLHRAIKLPPHVVARKICSKIVRKVLSFTEKWRDVWLPTYELQYLHETPKLYRFLKPLSAADLQSEFANELAGLYMRHTFDLLGSGWVQVRHGMRCRGVEGFRYRFEAVGQAEPEKQGIWLVSRINMANRTESAAIWKLVDKGYEPIDWQLDFKSGFRWSEKTWYKDIKYAQLPGVDIKVPWELSRMQHLSQLARAYALALNGQDCDERPEIYAREFRNQVLDFIAANPPRYGVNWQCTMDVAIRVANWVVAFDLFKAYGTEFDRDFDRVFLRSVYEHGKHIVENLEWSPELHGNHYLSDIVGLLFVAAYLPCAPETDAWLAFAVQELVNEVGCQFNPDGSNFEASTSYHRLAAELVIYGTALILALPEEKMAALRYYDHRLLKTRPELSPAPIAFFKKADDERATVFPEWYFEKLEKMAWFTLHTTRPDGQITQIGDNDSGRFLKLQPAYSRIKGAVAKKKYVNLDGAYDLLDDAELLVESHTDHSHLVAAFSGLLPRREFAAFLGNGHIESAFIRSLCGRRSASALQEAAVPAVAPHKCQLHEYPHFGAYIYKTRRLFLAIRCGNVGQNGNGGHAHNDQLSFELMVDGIPFIVDPGTYLYSPLPEKRNLFRSTIMHNTLFIQGKEQNTWQKGKEGLFSMRDKAKGRVIRADTYSFMAEHSGLGAIHRRSVEIDEKVICGIDECTEPGEKYILFHIGPAINVVAVENNNVILGACAKQIRLSSDHDGWVIKNDFYSESYGILQHTKTVMLKAVEERIKWAITIQ